MSDSKLLLDRDQLSLAAHALDWNLQTAVRVPVHIEKKKCAPPGIMIKCGEKQDSWKFPRNNSGTAMVFVSGATNHPAEPADLWRSCKATLMELPECKVCCDSLRNQQQRPRFCPSLRQLKTRDFIVGWTEIYAAWKGTNNLWTNDSWTGDHIV